MKIKKGKELQFIAVCAFILVLIWIAYEWLILNDDNSIVYLAVAGLGLLAAMAYKKFKELTGRR